MKTLPKAFGLLLLVMLFLYCFGRTDQGSFSFGDSGFHVSINGQEVHGPAKLVMGSVGLVASVIAGLCALVIGAIALAGSGVVILAVAVVIGLIFALISLPFLAPVAVPIAIIVAIVLACRTPRTIDQRALSNRAPLDRIR